MKPGDLAHPLVLAEKAIFTLVGVVFFIAAFALAIRGLVYLWPLITGPQSGLTDAATRFLDIMLLALMIVELTFTVIISLRGSVLTPEPFLLVGLIAVIRRLLVITIGEVGPDAKQSETTALQTQALELGVLAAVILALVFAIVLLRRSPGHAQKLEESPHGSLPHHPPPHNPPPPSPSPQ